MSLSSSPPSPPAGHDHGHRPILGIFALFAAAYMLSYAFRTVGAIMATPLRADLGIGSADLGLLTSAYFLSFCLMQLPLGMMLDRWGARKVNAGLMMVAASGAFLFAMAQDFGLLWVGRALIGIGVSACLMASYKGYAAWSPPSMQASLSSWMLMAGSLGALLATLPSQWLLGVMGWRGLFLLLGGLCVVAAVMLLWRLPRQEALDPDTRWGAQVAGYRAVLSNAGFRAMAPAGILVQGGFMALQGLWVGPWLNRLGGLDDGAKATTLFVYTTVLMLAYMALGMVSARWRMRPADQLRVLLVGMSLHVAAGLATGLSSGLASILFMGVMFVSVASANLAYVLVNASFEPHLIGRASTCYNFLIFAGAFGLQWGFGALLQWLQKGAGWEEAAALRCAWLTLIGLQCLAVLVLARSRRSITDRQAPPLHA